MGDLDARNLSGESLERVDDLFSRSMIMCILIASSLRMCVVAIWREKHEVTKTRLVCLSLTISDYSQPRNRDKCTRNARSHPPLQFTLKLHGICYPLIEMSFNIFPFCE